MTILGGRRDGIPDKMKENVLAGLLLRTMQTREREPERYFSPIEILMSIPLPDRACKYGKITEDDVVFLLGEVVNDGSIILKGPSYEIRGATRYERYRISAGRYRSMKGKLKDRVKSFEEYWAKPIEKRKGANLPEGWRWQTDFREVKEGDLTIIVRDRGVEKRDTIRARKNGKVLVIS